MAQYAAYACLGFYPLYQTPNPNLQSLSYATGYQNSSSLGGVPTGELYYTSGTTHSATVGPFSM